MEPTTLSTLVDLLKQSSPPSDISPLEDSGEKQASIFDLANSDRFRVLKVIEELLDSQEEVDKLRQKLEEEKLEFREKRGTLLKKLDAVNEKHEKALMDIQLLKEAHAQSLCKLEGKISTVSKKFEKSVEDTLELRKVNAELKKENLALKKQNGESSVTVSLVQEENSRLSVQLEKSRVKEKTLQKHLNNLSSKLNICSYNPSVSSSCSSLHDMISTRHRPLQPPANHSNPPVKRLGAGDCVDIEPSPPSFYSDVNTIKAPPVRVGLKDCRSSTFALLKEVEPPQPQQRKTNSALTSLEDMAILENLFFRF